MRALRIPKHSSPSAQTGPLAASMFLPTFDHWRIPPGSAGVGTSPLLRCVRNGKAPFDGETHRFAQLSSETINIRRGEAGWCRRPAEAVVGSAESWNRFKFQLLTHSDVSTGECLRSNNRRLEMYCRDNFNRGLASRRKLAAASWESDHKLVLSFSG